MGHGSAPHCDPRAGNSRLKAGAALLLWRERSLPCWWGHCCSRRTFFQEAGSGAGSHQGNGSMQLVGDPLGCLWQRGQVQVSRSAVHPRQRMATGDKTGSSQVLHLIQFWSTAQSYFYWFSQEISPSCFLAGSTVPFIFWLHCFVAQEVLCLLSSQAKP